MTESATIGPGSVVAARELNTVSGAAVRIPDPANTIEKFSMPSTPDRVLKPPSEGVSGEPDQ